MDNKIQNIENVLRKYGQEHLIQYYKKLDEKDKKTLLDQMEKIDFELI